MDTTYFLLSILVPGISFKTGLGQPSSEYSCSGTFDTNEGIIEVFLNDSSHCQWNFGTHQSEIFKVNFLGFSRAPQTICEKSHVKMQYGSSHIKHCGNQTVPYSVQTGSDLRISRDNGIGFVAKLSIVSDNTYTINDTNVTWIEASTACMKIGATLAEGYPVLSQNLQDLLSSREQLVNTRGTQDIHNLAGKYWLGMSVTPWVTLRGCVQWIASERQNAIVLKNNQKSECAVICVGKSGFLLSEYKCRCLEKMDDTEFIFMPNKRCVTRCPGNKKERCGDILHTLYEYFQGTVVNDTESKYCVIKENDNLIAEDCHNHHGFTCTLENGTKATFNPSLPIKPAIKKMTQQDAIEFCTSYTNSRHMTPEPVFPKPYFGEKYWTTISRGVVWNPLKGTEDTNISLAASIDVIKHTVKTSLTHSKEKHGFICQQETISCGGTFFDVEGELTSQNYPENYNNDETCEWILIVNDTLALQINISRLVIENSTSCVNDYLQIREKGRPPIRLCGTYTQKLILTEGNNVTFTMKSDASVTKGGFHLTWIAVSQPSEPTKSQNTISIYTLKGAAVAGITFGVVVLLLIVAAIVGFVYLKKRKFTPRINTSSCNTASHNALYDVSSFGSSTNVGGSTSLGAQYENLSTKRANATNGASATTYKPLPLNDSSNITSSSGHLSVTEPHTDHNPGNKSDDNSLVPQGSGYEDKDTNDKGMDAIDNMGKDCITVVCSEKIHTQTESNEYATINDDHISIDKNEVIRTQSKQSSTYLNADLPSDLRVFKNNPTGDGRTESSNCLVDGGENEIREASENNEYSTIL